VQSVAATHVMEQTMRGHRCLGVFSFRRLHIAPADVRDDGATVLLPH